MKKICFFIGNLNLTGGTERVTTVLANILNSQGYDVSILSIYEGLDPAFEVSRDIKLCQLFAVHVSMKLKFLSSILKIRKFVMDNKIETLIVVDSISCVFTTPALFGLKVNHICWEHFNFKFNFGSKFRDIGRKIATVCCDYVVTLTLKDGKDWRSYYKKTNANITTIYNPSPYSIQETNPNKDSKTVLYVGRLSKEKGVDLLLEAWSVTVKNNSDWRLKVIGNGAELKHLEQQCVDLGIQNSVVFEGECKDLVPYYQEAKFLCLPSREEGFGMVIIEAHSFGLPVLAFEIETGPKELIIEGTGILAKSYKINEFSENIHKMMSIAESDYIKYSTKCKNNARRFTGESIICKWKEIL